jgi:hypothetical protein
MGISELKTEISIAKLYDFKVLTMKAADFLQAHEPLLTRGLMPRSLAARTLRPERSYFLLRLYGDWLVGFSKML